MYIDIVALILIIILVVILNKRFSTFVLTVGALDILLRVIDFIKNNLGLKDLSRFLDKYFPSSFFGIIDKYTDGDINIILKLSTHFYLLLPTPYACILIIAALLGLRIAKDVCFTCCRSTNYISIAIIMGSCSISKNISLACS